MQLSLSGSSTVSGLSYYSFGILYGEYSGSAYPFPFDVESLIASKHQFFASSSAYCNARGGADSITISENHGFTRLVVALYRYA